MWRRDSAARRFAPVGLITLVQGELKASGLGLAPGGETRSWCLSHLLMPCSDKLRRFPPPSCLTFQFARKATGWSVRSRDDATPTPTSPQRHLKTNLKRSGSGKGRFAPFGCAVQLRDRRSVEWLLGCDESQRNVDRPASAPPVLCLSNDGSGARGNTNPQAKRAAKHTARDRRFTGAVLRRRK
jgi:hypothetical protein